MFLDFYFSFIYSQRGAETVVGGYSFYHGNILFISCLNVSVFLSCSASNMWKPGCNVVVFIILQTAPLISFFWPTQQVNRITEISLAFATRPSDTLEVILMYGHWTTNVKKKHYRGNITALKHKVLHSIVTFYTTTKALCIKYILHGHKDWNHK